MTRLSLTVNTDFLQLYTGRYPFKYLILPINGISSTFLSLTKRHFKHDFRSSVDFFSFANFRCGVLQLRNFYALHVIKLEKLNNLFDDSLDILFVTECRS